MTSPSIRPGALIRTQPPSALQTIIDDVFDEERAKTYGRHPVAGRCEAIIARDPGDNLVVIAGGKYYYWDHESDQLHLLGTSPADFIVGYEKD